jgi:hypothetical protein
MIMLPHMYYVREKVAYISVKTDAVTCSVLSSSIYVSRSVRSDLEHSPDLHENSPECHVIPTVALFNFVPPEAQRQPLEVLSWERHLCHLSAES